MDTKKLRQKILNLAIRGKLVPQDPNDEPASVLLERIKAEKGRLIKEGKIKKSKKSVKTSDTPHYPYLLPNRWCLSTLGEVFTLQAGKNITAKDIKDTTTELHPYKCYGGNGVRGFVASYNREGDFSIIGRQGALCGNINIAKGKFYATEHAVVVERYCDVDLMWAYYTLTALNLNQYATATAQPGLSVAVINDVCIPIPPQKEQERISKEIEHWFALIDQIEQGKADLQTIIKQAKAKILDLAIHGKLVPQDPNDEPAIELLKRINPDFIPCDNGHSEKLPQNWVWVKGKNIFLPMKSTKPKYNEFQYIDIDSIDNKQQIINEIKTIKTANAPSRASRYTQKNDVIFSMVRPYLRNIAKVVTDNCIASTGFYVCSAIPQILNSNYCYYLMVSDYVVNGLNQFMKGDNSPSISKGHIDEWLFPLPPLTEQQRIVQKIEELFSVLDNIQNALEV
ncbi:restriction endonuclease subunit S [Bacteroides clarus]|uniref:restriction endonuclease subunit S n=1 Tax=Bacteroides clarus TaxID=626929 RepID=UPI0021009300|nr:restriction endonuclease subunit S [Bacteroides clarus]MCQ1544709.1 restriction endonuclease subunit S [Bacteroides clarus]